MSNTKLIIISCFFLLKASSINNDINTFRYRSKSVMEMNYRKCKEIKVKNGKIKSSGKQLICQDENMFKSFQSLVA